MLSVERGDNSLEITKMLLESPDMNINCRSESDSKHEYKLMTKWCLFTLFENVKEDSTTNKTFFKPIPNEMYWELHEIIYIDKVLLV